MELNYKSVYFFLLSLFGIILILTLLEKINSNFATIYSIIGTVTCIIVWIIDDQIVYEADRIKNQPAYPTPYHGRKIHEILGKRITLTVCLVVILSLEFVLLIIIE